MNLAERITPRCICHTLKPLGQTVSIVYTTYKSFSNIAFISSYAKSVC